MGCGWCILRPGQTVGFLRFEAGVQEIFAVQVLPGMRFPEVLEWGDERLAHSYVLPDAALAEVALPTAEELARSPALHFQRGTAFIARASSRRRLPPTGSVWPWTRPFPTPATTWGWRWAMPSSTRRRWRGYSR